LTRYIQFCRGKEWTVILRDNFDVLLCQIKKGKVDFIAPETLTEEERQRIEKEGFVFVSGHIKTCGGKQGRRVLKVVAIVH